MKRTKAIVFFILINFVLPFLSARSDFPFKQQVRVGAGGAFSQKLQVKNKGVDYFEPLIGVGVEINVHYYRHFYKGLGIQGGVEFKLTPPSACRIPGKQYQWPYSHVFYYNQDFFLDNFQCNIPIAVNYAFLIRNRYFIDVHAGYAATLQRANGITISGYSGSDEYGNQIQFYKMYSEPTKPYISNIFVKLGFNIVTKRQDSYGFYVICNYSPEVISQGEYRFYNIPAQSGGAASEGASGSFKRYNNYLECQFTYGFSLGKKGKITDF